MQAKDDLYELARGVSSRSDLIAFIEALNADFVARRAEWANDRIDLFLGGLCGFTRDMGGYYENMGEVVDVETATWRMVAQMLLAATVYE
jgi:hypothetical protein